MEEIIARAVRGEATPQELARLAEWRAESPDNERAYQETAYLLKALRSAGQHPRSEPPRAVELLRRMERSGKRPASRGLARFIPWGIAAAAVAALAGQLWSGSQFRPASGQTTQAAETAETAEAAEAAEAAEVVTGAGELATVRLPDGSVARLAPRSRLRLLPTRHERSVWVDGHAFFAVAKHPSQPFRVRTAEGDLVALGTRFDVRTEPRGLRLVVLEGRVALLARGERTEVGTGEAAGVHDGLRFPVSKIGNPDDVTRWMRRFLAFQSTPLLQVTIEIERAYGRRIVLANPSLAGETVTATFTDESLERVMDVVCTVVGVECVVTDSLVSIGQ